MPHATFVPPASHRALKVQESGIARVTHDAAVPKLSGAGEILVRVVCVSINPFDWKSLDMSPAPGATWGCDFSGEVVAVDEELSNRWQLGDRVGGAMPGNDANDLNNGGFGEYVRASEALLFKMPPGMSFEQAATLGVGMATIGVALYHSLKLPLPFSDGTTLSPPQHVLVYGGGTATGTLAIQALRKSGMRPITTCSPRHIERLKSLGLEAAWDYRSPSCASDIRQYTNDELTLALDCITDSSSMKVCYAAIGKHGGKYIGLDQFPIREHSRRDILPGWIIAWTVLGKPISMKRPYRRDAKPRDEAFGRVWSPVCQRLLDDGSIIPHPFEVRSGGLEAVLAGSDEIRKGLAGGKKLVYQVNAPSVGEPLAIA